jgi:hypothetical protein
VAVWVAPMAKARRRLPSAPPTRAIVPTTEFQEWAAGLRPELRAKVMATIGRIVAGGPTQGRPHADVIHGSRLHKLKEARVDRGTRVLFAFDSNQNLVMLLGGDKTGKWNRWYRPNIERAEDLYLDHERSIGKGAHCLSQRAAQRTSSQASR